MSGFAHTNSISLYRARPSATPWSTLSLLYVAPVHTQAGPVYP